MSVARVLLVARDWHWESHKRSVGWLGFVINNTQKNNKQKRRKIDQKGGEKGQGARRERGITQLTSEEPNISIMRAKAIA